MNATTSNSTELHRELQGFCGSPVQLALGLSLLLAIASPVLRAQAPAAQAPQAQTAQAVQTLAFPGAEGYGATATGGRGKQVIAVTTLADDGPGSFRAAVTHSGATVVFNVNGVIHLKSHNVIIRYMRFRGGIAESQGSSSLQLGNASHVMLDHLSIEWGRWDNIQAEGNSYTTLQNSIIGEGIVPQRFGCLCESDYISFSHNLWIDNKSRNPKGKGHIQYIDNVVYNWGVDGYVGGHGGADHYADLINNYFIAGPDSSASFIGEFTKTDHTYQFGNLLDANRNGKLDGRPVTQADFEKVNADILPKPFATPDVPVHIDPADSIVGEIARQAGDSLCRDAVDARLVGDLLSYGTKGKLIADESEVGGHPPTVEAKAALDSDGDGIPDAWELKHHLNPYNAADALVIDAKTGYSNLDLYLNELADQPVRQCAASR
jgi:hypothetical protein